MKLFSIVSCLMKLLADLKETFELTVSDLYLENADSTLKELYTSKCIYTFILQKYTKVLYSMGHSMP